ncbi:MAG: serine/threonine protein kinase [Myxococcales bacterium]|nr:serine/threonine protein kinase [Myxococcales bacterium]
MTDDDVTALVRALRWEEACDLALARGDRLRAFAIAIEARDLPRQERLVSGLSAEDDPKAIAVALRHGDRLAEGLVHGRFERGDDAAACFEAAGEFRRAAATLRRCGKTAEAGRALEAHLRARPDDEAAAVELGALCLELGRAEAALRVLRDLAGDEARSLRERARRALEGASDTALPSPWLFGRYEVVREVATTATSRVLEALDRLEPGAPRVALKVFVGGGQSGAGRDALVRFEREVQIVSLLDAPTVLRPRALLPEGPTLVLPWLGGGSAQGLVERGAVPARRAAEIVDRVLLALGAAHRRGVVHRDVKPSNILLDDVGGAFLTDFGVAHLGDAGATATAGVLGTLRYMAPEQRAGEPATPRSDLYALGVVLGELLGARAAFPPAVAALVDRWTAEEESERPASAEEARAELTAIAWPDEPFSTEVPSLRPSGASSRFVEESAQIWNDTLLDRRERCIAAGSPIAAVLLRLRDPALPRILGQRGGMLRIEIVRGAARAPTAEESTRLAPLVEALHASGAIVKVVETERGLALALV